MSKPVTDVEEILYRYMHTCIYTCTHTYIPKKGPVANTAFCDKVTKRDVPTADDVLSAAALTANHSSPERPSLLG